MGNSVGDGGWLTTPVSPAGWNPLPFRIGGRRVGGGRIGASRRKSARKTPSALRNRNRIGNYCGSESGRRFAIA